MTKDLIKQAENIVRQAEKLGAQGVHAMIHRSRESTLEWRDGKLDRLRESTSMGLTVSLHVDGRYSSNSTSDLRPPAVERFLEETVAMTKVLAEDPHRVLPHPSRYENRYQGDMKIFDPSAPVGLDPDQRKTLVKSIEEAARSSQHADKIISVTCECSDSDSESALVVSNGMQGTSRSTHFVIGAQTSVKDKGDRKPEGYSYAVTHMKDRLPSADVIGSDATRRALSDMGAKPIKSGRYACIIENRLIRRILGGLFYPLSGGMIQQKRSFMADKLGKQVTSPLLSIIDDPHQPEGLGSRTFDDEGMSTQKMPILENGVLKNFYLNTYYASKLEMEPTTGSESNLSFAAGNRNLEKLLQKMDTGILVTGFSGGNSNSATGDFSIGISGQWVENGRIKHPVSEMNLAGNHLAFWNQVVELGNDIYPYSSWLTPSIRLENVQFSGK